jgi:hypothetical protein
MGGADTKEGLAVKSMLEQRQNQPLILTVRMISQDWINFPKSGAIHLQEKNQSGRKTT